jgi:hypothetical protein
MSMCVESRAYNALNRQGDAICWVKKAGQQWFVSPLPDWASRLVELAAD